MLTTCDAMYFLSFLPLCCACSHEEIARYLETFRLYENKGADLIKERVDASDAKAPLAAALSTIRAVNKTDVATLASQFGVHFFRSLTVCFAATDRLPNGAAVIPSHGACIDGGARDVPRFGPEKSEAHFQCVPPTVHHVTGHWAAPPQSGRRRSGVSAQTAADHSRLCLCAGGREQRNLCARAFAVACKDDRQRQCQRQHQLQL
jgi:hypothetical protein